MRDYINKVKEKQHLTYEEMEEVANVLFSEDAASADIEEFLIALSEKGETALEIAALASVMRTFANNVEAPLGSFMDNCGTGGDGTNSFNVSTTTAFVLAGAGAKVAKHGNRKVSSAAGSSDVLEALGIRLDFTSEEISELLEKEGITFLYAPNVHPKMKRIGAIRQKIGKRTIFNLVGPLTNPIPLSTQFAGISKSDFTMEYATALHMLGRKRAIVVAGAEGMDEASLSGQNSFVLLDRGDLIPFSLTAEDVGLTSAPISSILGGDANENAEILRSVLGGERGPRFDTVVFNAGIGLFANGQAETIAEGVHQATESILSGAAYRKLEAVIAFSKKVSEEEVVN
ncbi:anthranilate phosphoribosyltransferase [Sporosarcina sp. FA9]|uniref:anthranilate phosphoribosyltransferase n=1 Tax=Sporosarcina sp. FA9 TaxID=3413030 RepID=UPI003F65850B